MEKPCYENIPLKTFKAQYVKLITGLSKDTPLVLQATLTSNKRLIYSFAAYFIKNK